MNPKSAILGKFGVSSFGVKNKTLVAFIRERTGWEQPKKDAKRLYPFLWKYYAEFLCKGDKLEAERAAAKGRFHMARVLPVTNTPKDHGFTHAAWVVVRYEALKIHGAKCQCCGATAASSGKPLHVDHIKPKSVYPELSLDVSNLQVLCADCNMGKGAWDETDWRSIEASSAVNH